MKLSSTRSINWLANELVTRHNSTHARIRWFISAMYTWQRTPHSLIRAQRTAPTTRLIYFSPCMTTSSRLLPTNIHFVMNSQPNCWWTAFGIRLCLFKQRFDVRNDVNDEKTCLIRDITASVCHFHTVVWFTYDGINSITNPSKKMNGWAN